VKRVTGIGGIFIKSADPARLRAWYQQHLGIDVAAWGGATFQDTPTTVWNVFEASSNYFDPSRAPFMVNFRVAGLVPLLAALRAEGCTGEGDGAESEYGRFAWVIDPDGNKVELWEPPAGQ
jgi:catechol 2,3-dioxygenase-like lactoylglutathione lyase family enzyme